MRIHRLFVSAFCLMAFLSFSENAYSGTLSGEYTSRSLTFSFDGNNISIEGDGGLFEEGTHIVSGSNLIISFPDQGKYSPAWKWTCKIKYGDIHCPAAEDFVKSVLTNGKTPKRVNNSSNKRKPERIRAVRRKCPSKYAHTGGWCNPVDGVGFLAPTYAIHKGGSSCPRGFTKSNDYFCVEM
jgi:hypothetical protein